jgi:hypothetical protein
MTFHRNVFIALFVLLCLTGCQDQEGDTDPNASPTSSPTASAGAGEPSPKFNLTAPDGSTVTFDPSDNPDNEAFLVLFWSYRWDPNVSVFLDRAAELHERYAPRGLTIYGVSYDEEPDGLRKYLSQNPVPFEVAVGADSTYEKFKVESIPTAILVDSSGRIVDRWSGYFTTEELANRISPHLPGRSGNSQE